MTKIEYVTIRLPSSITDTVDKLVGKHGFSSRAEVIKSALRDLFETYPETKIKGSQKEV